MNGLKHHTLPLEVALLRGKSSPTCVYPCVYPSGCLPLLPYVRPVEAGMLTGGEAAVEMGKEQHFESV